MDVGDEGVVFKGEDNNNSSLKAVLSPLLYCCCDSGGLGGIRLPPCTALCRNLVIGDATAKVCDRWRELRRVRDKIVLIKSRENQRIAFRVWYRTRSNH